MNDELCSLDKAKYLSVNGQYVTLSWFNLNSLLSTALETTVKFSRIKPEVTENDLDHIVKHFCMYPGRAKARNGRRFTHQNGNGSDDEK